MSLLSVVQQHCKIYALNVPATVVGSQDTTIKQIWGLMNDIVENLVDESNWQAFGRECTYTLIVGEDQGAIKDIIGVNGDAELWLKNETFYDRTLMRPLYGPVTDVEWQALKAIPNPGPWYKYRIWQDHLWINPAVTADSGLDEIAFEYSTNLGVIADDGTLKAQFTLDTDKSVLPERIMQKGLAYRWKETKGLPFDRDEKRYFDMLSNYIARDATGRAYRLDCPVDFNITPGIFIPSGNWPVTN